MGLGQFCPGTHYPPWWVRIVGSALVNKLGLILVGTSFQSENTHLNLLILIISRNLSMKEGSLFCFVWFGSYEIHQTRMLSRGALACLVP
jgi:hypothetical protein